MLVFIPISYNYTIKPETLYMSLIQLFSDISNQEPLIIQTTSKSTITFITIKEEIKKKP